MKCVFCGNEINDGSIFCKFCGMKIEPIVFQDSLNDHSQVKKALTDAFIDTEAVTVNQPIDEEKKYENIGCSKTEPHNPQKINRSKSVPLSKREKVLVGIFLTITICLSLVIILLTIEINSFNQNNESSEVSGVNIEDKMTYKLGTAVEINAPYGMFTITVNDVHCVNWDKDNQMITVQMEVENTSFIKAKNLQCVRHYEIRDYAFEIYDTNGNPLEFYNIAPDTYIDGDYKVNGEIGVGKTESIALPFYLTPGCSSVSLKIGNYRSKSISLDVDTVSAKY